MVPVNPPLLELFPDNTYDERHFDGIEFKDSDTGKSIVFGYWADFPAYNPRTGKRENIGSKQLWLLKLVVSHMIKPSLKLIKDAYGLDLINDSNMNFFEIPTNVMSDGKRTAVFLSMTKNIVPIYISKVLIIQKRKIFRLNQTLSLLLILFLVMLLTIRIISIVIICAQ